MREIINKHLNFVALLLSLQVVVYSQNAESNQYISLEKNDSVVKQLSNDKEPTSKTNQKPDVDDALIINLASLDASFCSFIPSTIIINSRNAFTDYGIQIRAPPYLLFS